MVNQSISVCTYLSTKNKQKDSFFVSQFKRGLCHIISNKRRQNHQIDLQYQKILKVQDMYLTTFELNTMNALWVLNVERKLDDTIRLIKFLLIKL